MIQEVWIPVKGFELRYAISNYGNLKRVISLMKSGKLSKEIIITKKITNEGYVRFVLFNGTGKKKQFYAHRLVAIAFIINKHNKPDINHKDCNKLNNHPSNLEWCTPQENNAHAKYNNLCRGRRLDISIDDRIYIKENATSTNREFLAEKFKLSKSMIYRISTNRDGLGEKFSIKGSHLKKQYTQRPPRYKKVIDITTGETVTTKDMCKILGIKLHRVYKLLNDQIPNTTQFKYA